LLQGIDEFNRQLYFECHETLESIWITEPDPVRYLYQGILLVGVGFYHWRRRNRRGAMAKLAQGVDKLQWFRPACLTVDVDRLIREAEACRAHLLASGPDRLPPFPPPHLPRVHLVGAPPRPSGNPAVTQPRHRTE
jgi:predicted metal-dependent hydrolase